MFCQTSGNEKNIVLLHGWGFDSSVMHKLAEILALNYRVTTIDLPGYGVNEQQLFPDTLHALADSISPHVPEKSILIGWSLGGLVALQMALKSKFEKIYVIAGTPCFMAKENWPAMPETTFNHFFNQVKDDKNKGLDMFLYLNLQGAIHDKTAYKKLKNMLQKTAAQDTLLNGLNILKQADLRDDIRNINCPIQFILAEHDNLIDAEMADKLHLYSEKVEVIILKNTNHAMIYFNADLIANAFFSSIKEN